MPPEIGERLTELGEILTDIDGTWSDLANEPSLGQFRHNIWVGHSEGLGHQNSAEFGECGRTRPNVVGPGGEAGGSFPKVGPDSTEYVTELAHPQNMRSCRIGRYSVGFIEPIVPDVPP